MLIKFNKVGVKKPSIRISIHGIPMHVEDSEIEQWVDQYVVRDTPVTPAQVKNKDSQFTQLFSGNRYCYAQTIITPIPRYVKYLMPDPVQIGRPNPSLIEMIVTVYHEDQPINCKKCLDLGHTFDICPKRNRFNRPERKCYKCGEAGHFARNCVEMGTETERKRDAPLRDASTPEGNKNDAQESFIAELMQDQSGAESRVSSMLESPQSIPAEICEVSVARSKDSRGNGRQPKESNVTPVPRRHRSAQEQVSYPESVGSREISYSSKRSAKFTPPSTERQQKKQQQTMTENIRSWFLKPGYKT